MKLSVIIPGYNTPERLWCRCVDSVCRSLDSVDGESEIICVDDGSRNDLRCLEALTKRDCRIRVIQLEQNGGQAHARNVALDAARGEYVTFVDSDDEVVPGVYRQCLMEMIRDSADIGVFGVKSVWVKEGLQRVDVLPTRNLGRLGPDEVETLLDNWLLYYPWNKIFRMSYLRQPSHGHSLPLRFDVNGMPCEDAIFNLECVMEGARWCVIDKVGYLYYRTSGSSLSRYKSTLAQGRRHCAETWKRYCDSLPSESAKRFASYCDCSEIRLLCAEWDNIWRPCSPFSLLGRWTWLRNRPQLGGVGLYLRTLMKVLFRRTCYVRMIRRWHLCRIFARLEDIPR